MIIYYFGADSPWVNQKEMDINRRNMAILLALGQQKKVSLVYNVIRTTRKNLFTKKARKRSTHPKIKNIYIGVVFPQRGILKRLALPINRFIIKYIINSNLQTKNAKYWCYWPKGFNDFSFFTKNRDMIFDTDHNIIDDPNLDLNHKKERTELLLEAGNKASLILSSSRSMIAWYETKGINRVKLLMNGVFKSRVDLKNKNLMDTFQVTYCGTLSKWMKLDWLIQMAKDHPEWLVNVIGDNHKTEHFSVLKKIENVKMHGYLDPAKVDVILKQSNVCLGLYREDAALDVNSMKLYDYLSKGLPVVVNKYHNNLECDFDNLIHVVDDYNAFIEAIKSAQKPNEQKLERFLENAYWNNRVERIMSEIDVR